MIPTAGRVVVMVDVKDDNNLGASHVSVLSSPEQQCESGSAGPAGSREIREARHVKIVVNFPKTLLPPPPVILSNPEQ